MIELESITPISTNDLAARLLKKIPHTRTIIAAIVGETFVELDVSIRYTCHISEINDKRFDKLVG